MIARASRSARNRSQASARRVRGVRIATLRALGVVEGGGAARLGRGVHLDLYGTLRLGRGVQLDDGCSLQVSPGAVLELGDHVYVGRGSVIAAGASVTIGARTMIGEHVTIRDADHSNDPGERHGEWSGENAARIEPLRIGDDVWVGAGARVLRGATLGAASVVAANAVVRSLVPDGAVAAGVPARIVRAS